jgi:hypothetical protein
MDMMKGLDTAPAPKSVPVLVAPLPGPPKVPETPGGGGFTPPMPLAGGGKGGALGPPGTDLTAKEGVGLPPMRTLTLPAKGLAGPAADGGAGAGFGAGPGGGFILETEKELRRRGMFKELLQRQAARDVLLPELLEPTVLREYAHRHTAGPDHAEVLLWQPVLVSKDGTARIAFDFSDLATTHQITVFAHSPDGRLGAGTFLLPVRASK